MTTKPTTPTPDATAPADIATVTDAVTDLLTEIAWKKLSAARANGTLLQELAALDNLGYERGLRDAAAERDTP